MRILLVEDDREIAEYIGRGLEEEGNRVTLCFDGAAGLRAAQTPAYDILVLDVMLPLLDGIELTRRLRAANIATPILLLTARDAAQDVVRGLDAGADDYLTKPFSFDVLLARLRARTRVNQSAGPAKLEYSDLTIDPESHQAWRGKTAVNLTRTEFAIVEHLMRSAGRVVPRARLIEAVWGAEREVGNNNLDVFIRFLRVKLDGPHHPRLIHTVRGLGYCLREEP
ncbi:MAG TPA: response regulator transcription factor [Bryobacteraceae bacterium]|nr:response regulator transcription factor [Bryobacteraceae bacterium]